MSSSNDFLDDVSAERLGGLVGTNHDFQYSQYAGRVAATPQKSTAPAATIGGEPGGRAAVVVNDVPVVAEPYTSLAIGQAAPGVDVFGVPAPDIKSDHLPPPPPQVPEEAKEISSVEIPKPKEPEVIGGPEEMLQAAKEKTLVGKETTEDPQAGIQVENLEPSVPKPQPTPPAQPPHVEAKDPVVPPAPVAAAPAGPLGEADMEAEKAAEDLYPEAV